MKFDPSRTEAFGVGLCDGQGVFGQVECGYRDGGRGIDRDGDGDGSAAGPDVDDPGLRMVVQPVQRPFDEKLSFWSRCQDRWADDNFVAEEFSVPKDVRDWLTGQSPFGKHLYVARNVVREWFMQHGQ